jgi:hypothetical protein
VRFTVEDTVFGSSKVRTEEREREYSLKILRALGPSICERIQGSCYVLRQDFIGSKGLEKWIQYNTDILYQEIKSTGILKRNRASRSDGQYFAF